MRKWHVPDWENNLAELQTTTPPTTDGSWYVNPHGQTFSVIRIRPFQQGSDPDFNPHYSGTSESLRRMDINRTIAISTTPITIRHYDAFQKVSGSPNAKELDLDAPVNHMTWFNAAAYCNWLSEQEGIPQEEWCYEPRNGTYGKGMKFAVGSREKSGYRLPNASEWEFACRSGNPPVMNRYYGTSDEILVDYAWYGNDGGTVMPVGLRRPNEIGLFDMLGNVHEWTATHRAGASGRRTIMALDEMIARGGSYMTLPKYVRDTSMYFEHARIGSKHQGFRIVRTLQPSEK